ncbi:MAG: hypothetical protein XXXJIFNMEKO3_00829 [Candidatus Erwinia impunctatus]|nr:hypothetical protein XXXJIFNMEKO_00829 [Culicoides impunctatus]
MNEVIKKVLRPLYYKMTPSMRQKAHQCYRVLLKIFSSKKSYKSHYSEVNISGDVACLSQLKGNDTGLDILLFPVTDWDFRLQRPQQLVLELAKLDNRIIYFSTTFNLSSAPGFTIKKMAARNIVLCTLNINKHEINIYRDIPDEQQINFLLQGLYLVRQAIGFKFTHSIINYPFWGTVVARLSSNSIIYDCMDYHAGFENNEMHVSSEENKLINSAYLVFTTAKNISDLIAETKKYHHP